MWFREGDEKKGRKANRRNKTAGEQILQVEARSQEKKQARVRWISAVVTLGVAIGGCIWVGLMGADWIRLQLFATNPLFTMREPDIRTDGTLKPQEIRERYNLNAGLNLFALNLATIHADLLTLPGVRSVEIRRQLPDTLIVRVGERSAVALLVTDKMSLPIDREGFLLVPRSAVTRLPVIVGGSVPGLKPGMQVKDVKICDALTVLDLCEAQHLGDTIRVDSINVAHPETLELRLASGERVPLARVQMDDRLRKLASVKKALADRHQVASLIDCSLDRGVPVKLALPVLAGATN
jgi:cell division septal protein FtsQ